MDRREERLRQVYESVENNLQLIGAIGIEDRLQVNIMLQTSGCCKEHSVLTPVLLSTFFTCDSSVYLYPLIAVSACVSLCIFVAQCGVRMKSQILTENV